MPRALTPARPDLYEETRRSLEREPKELSPVWLYDERGSLLFDEITRLPEYYPTRTEAAILEAHAGEMVDAVPKGGALIEFGSGSSLKTEQTA